MTSITLQYRMDHTNDRTRHDCFFVDAPIKHPFGTVHKTKEEAQQSEKEELK